MEKLEDVNNDIDIIAQISSAADKMRKGEYAGYEILKNLADTSQNPKNKERASKELKEICLQIQRRWNEDIRYNTIPIPDTSLTKILKRYQDNPVSFTNIRRFGLLNFQDKLNTINNMFIKRFSVCDIEEFADWAKENGIEFSLEPYNPE